jgi:hypothetical protein
MFATAVLGISCTSLADAVAQTQLQHEGKAGTTYSQLWSCVAKAGLATYLQECSPVYLEPLGITHLSVIKRIL